MSKRKKKKTRPHKPSKGPSTVVAQDETLTQVDTGDGEGEASVEASAPEAAPGEDNQGAAVAESAEATEEATADAVEPDEGTPATPLEAEPADVAPTEMDTGVDTVIEPAEAEDVAATGEAGPESADGDWSMDAGPMAEATNEEFAAAWSDASGSGEGDPTGDGEGEGEPADATADGEPAPLEGFRLESVLESLLFASDKALGVAELKKLSGEKEAKKISEALDALIERRKGTGIEIVRLSGGWHMRTNAENAPWVSKLLQGKPMRLTRAMMETLAIVAYRQPVTRPEIDDIRGVDCGPVLRTLLERNLIRVIGKKEEVGRPMLYGSTPEFLRVFNLRDLSELPTLREFYDLSSENQSKVEAEHGPTTPSATSAKPEVAMGFVPRSDLPPEPEEDDPLLEEIDRATAVAKKALGDAQEPAPEEEGKPESAPPPAET